MRGIHAAVFDGADPVVAVRSVGRLVAMVDSAEGAARQVQM